MASRIAENKGFTIVHDIVDSLWLKKEDATARDYLDLCKEVSDEIKVPLNFEGRYKWIVFLPSKLRHCPNSDDLILAAKKSRLKLYFAVDFQ